MIKVTDLTFGFPQKDLYNNVCFEIEAGDHAVLIGSNGCGKSTLVEMLIDTEKYLYDGKIEKDESMRIGYVSQYTSHEGSMPVYDFLAMPFNELQAQADALCAEMETAEEMDAVYERYQAVLDQIEAIDGYNSDTNIQKQLAIAGLTKLTDLAVDKISGGEYKLLSIIRNMLQKPQLLIMDEPDVFLDFENLVGLSKLINNYEGTILVITHNRLLLSQCFNKILHLENAELQEFPGTFAQYNTSLLETKTLTMEQATKDAEWIEIQQKLVEKIRAKATKIDSATTGRQLKARVTYLERLQARAAKNPFIEDFAYDIHFPDVAVQDITESENADLTAMEVAEAAETEHAMQTAGEVSGPPSASKLAAETEAETTNEVAETETETTNETAETQTLIKVEDYELKFDRTILFDVNFEIKEGEKVAIVGANGTGKSSLLTDIVSVVLGEKSGNKALPLAAAGTPDCADEMSITSSLRKDEVAYFTQIYEDTEKLSGGEKNIKQLQKIAQSGAKMLFLDEPTSHLDTYAQIALENAVAEYKGTVLMVTHDFYTVSNCVDRILLLEDGTMREMSPRAFRKMIYKRYFESDVFETERLRKELEVRVNALLKKGNYKEAKTILGLE